MYNVLSFSGSGICGWVWSRASNCDLVFLQCSHKLDAVFRCLSVVAWYKPSLRLPTMRNIQSCFTCLDVLGGLPFWTALRSMHDAAAYRVKFSSLFMGQLASECGQTPFPQLRSSFSWTKSLGFCIPARMLTFLLSFGYKNMCCPYPSNQQIHNNL